MSASIPLDELKSLIQDAFPGATETQAWLRDRFGLPEAEPSGALELALASLSAQPGDVVLTRLLDAAPFLVDRARVLAVSLDLTLPGPVLDEADFSVRRGVSVLVNLLAGGDYALAYRFFHRCFAWGAKAADVEPGHALASLDRLSDNLLQLGVHKHEEMFKVLLAEHPGHAEEIQRLARLMGHFNLATPPRPLPLPDPSPLDRLFALLHRARVAVVAWPRPSRFALVLLPSLTVFLVFFTASAPLQDVEETLAQLQVEGLHKELAGLHQQLEVKEREIKRIENDYSRLEAQRDELEQENIRLNQKDKLAQEALKEAQAVTLDQAKRIESFRRKNQALLDANEKLTALAAAAEEPPVTVSPDPQATPLPQPP